MDQNEYIPSGKIYQLKTYEDFMALSVEQFEMMLPDFLEWKRTQVFLAQVNEMAMAIDPNSTIEMPTVFEWIDDGKHDGISLIEIKDRDSGASIQLNLPNNK